MCRTFFRFFRYLVKYFRRDLSKFHSLPLIPMTSKSTFLDDSIVQQGEDRYWLLKDLIFDFTSTILIMNMHTILYFWRFLRWDFLTRKEVDIFVFVLLSFQYEPKEANYFCRNILCVLSFHINRLAFCSYFFFPASKKNPRIYRVCPKKHISVILTYFLIFCFEQNWAHTNWAIPPLTTTWNSSPPFWRSETGWFGDYYGEDRGDSYRWPSCIHYSSSHGSKILRQLTFICRHTKGLTLFIMFL